MQDTAEIKALRGDFKAMFKELKVLFNDSVEKQKQGVLEASEVDKIVKLTSTLKSMRETAFSIYDVLSIKEKKDLQLREKESEFKQQYAELKAEIELLKIGG